MPETRNKLETWLLASQKYLYQRMRPAVPGEQQRLFIAGMQRSGTNMVMEILEQNFDTDVYHEYDPRAFANYQMREDGQIGQLIDQSQANLFVIKSLCELHDLSRLMELFGPAKTVWIVRHYDDTANSMLRSFRNMAAQVQRIAADKDDKDEWYSHGMSDITHALLVSCVDSGLTDASASALQWYFRNILFFEQGFDLNERVCLVFYEDLVTQPEREFKRIFEFAGLEFHPKYVRRVSARSIRKNEPPVVADDIRALCNDLYGRFTELR